jgi:hypothetical protein
MPLQSEWASLIPQCKFAASWVGSDLMGASQDGSQAESQL